MKDKVAPLYRVVRVVVEPVFKFLFRMRIHGRENLPASGPYIICANHVNALDCITMALAVPKRQVHFMAKATLWKAFGPFKFVLDKLGVIPVNRDSNDLNALRIGSKTLKGESILGIFPEGTRVRTGEIGQGMPGTAYLAVRNRVPVVPCRIRGSYKLFGGVDIYIGNAMELTEFYERRANTEALAEGTEAIMERIRGL